jgi:hypothetical protein
MQRLEEKSSACQGSNPSCLIMSYGVSNVEASGSVIRVFDVS